MGPYNRVCIAALRQPNFYLLRRHAAPRYRLQIVFPKAAIHEAPAIDEGDDKRDPPIELRQPHGSRLRSTREAAVIF